jgi:hypothetical protein
VHFQGSVDSIHRFRVEQSDTTAKAIDGDCAKLLDLSFRLSVGNRDEGLEGMNDASIRSQGHHRHHTSMGDRSRVGTVVADNEHRPSLVRFYADTRLQISPMHLSTQHDQAFPRS